MSNLNAAPTMGNVFIHGDGKLVMTISAKSITIAEGVDVDEAAQAVIAALEGHIKALVASENERLRDAIKLYKSEHENPVPDYTLRSRYREQMFALLETER